MQTSTQTLVVLGTGGTIAGSARDRNDNVGYTAAQLGVADLVAQVPPLADGPLEVEQVLQLDSKDMGPAGWQSLARRVAYHVARPEVGGLVVTHGTDTVEETAYLLHRLLAPAKPVVVTAAMRPASALAPDGPQNLADAAAVARTADARGVLFAFGGKVFGATGLRKLGSYGLDVFDAGPGGPLAAVIEGRPRLDRPWPTGAALGLSRIERDASGWPRVEIVLNHAGADGRIVHDLVAAGVQGLVVAGTGNGTVSVALQAALLEAQAAGVRILRSTRCGAGSVVGDRPEALEPTPLTPVQARIELLLELLER